MHHKEAYFLKIDWNQKYTTIAVYTVLTALCITLIAAAVVNFPIIAGLIGKLNTILSPVYIGLIMAYLFNPILMFCEKYIVCFKVKSKQKQSLKRGLSLVLTYIIVLILLTIILLMIIPQVYLSFTDLASKLSGYLNSTVTLINEFSDKINQFMTDSIFSDLFGSDVNNIDDFYNKYIADYFDLSQLTSKITELVSNITNQFPKIFDYFSNIASGFINVIIGIIFSIYFLSAKETLIAQSKKLLAAVTRPKTYKAILELCSFTDHTFGGFIVGKILDSLIIGILCFIVCAICGMPYALLLSVFVGITNIIPVVGPIIGAVPGFFIIFIIDPIKALWFLVIIVIIQQLDGNVIGPKILGQTTGVSAIWVLFSITVMGGLFGLVGMLIAVPLFAVIYSLVKIQAEKWLSVQSLPIATTEYLSGSDKDLIDDSEHTFAAKLARLNANFAENPLAKKVRQMFTKKK